MKKIIEQFSTMVVPKHIAIVMDGNGRWAQKQMLPRIAGHHRGVESVRKVVQYCCDRPIEVLTLFAFSKENWQRPSYEVKALMTLLRKVLQEEIKEIHNNNICLHVIGNVKDLSIPLQKVISEAEELTKNNTKLHLNIAINYSGKWDITQSMQHIAEDVENRLITSKEIKEETIDKYLSLSSFQEPDLLIRTSGEQRISNFLLWQLAYTELYFSPILWPDFDEQAMNDAITWYSLRQRRFGIVNKEVENRIDA